MNLPILSDIVIRVPQWEDAQQIVDLLNATDIALGHEAETTLDTVLNEWQTPGFTLATNAWVAMTPNGQIVGYEVVFDTDDTGHIFVDGYVHPLYLNRGIGTSLLRLVEQWVRAHMAQFSLSAPVAVQIGTDSSDIAASQLLIAEGYQTIRHFWRMEIELHDGLPTPQWPEGIMVRTLIPNQDEYETFTTADTSFEDHWGHTSGTFEDWQHTHLNRDTYDPTLYFLAVSTETGEIVGVTLSYVRGQPNESRLGWIRTVAVLRPYRGRGIALALLHHAFAEFYRRGMQRVGLGVDAQSLTGATRVYERAGMHIARRFDTFEKEFRPAAIKATETIMPDNEH